MSNIKTAPVPKTVSVDKREYLILKKISKRYFELAESLTADAAVYSYDIEYIEKLFRKAKAEYKAKKIIEAENINTALRQFKTLK